MPEGHLRHDPFASIDANRKTTVVGQSQRDNTATL